MSRATTSLDEWIDLEPDDETSGDDATDENAPDWPESAIRCRCGADIGRWHTPAESRRLRRVYANGDGRVPACPDCIDFESGSHDHDSVPHAVRQLEPESSCDRFDHVELVLREVDR